MRALWLQNLKDWATGTASGGKNGIDVNVINTVSTTGGALTYKERRFHLPASTTINKRSGAWVQLDVNSDVAPATPADVANTCSVLEMNLNEGAAIEIGKGANAGAVTAIAAGGAGQSKSVGVSLVSGDKIWIRALQDVDIVTGEILIVLSG
jgi:hypothetical protein